MNPRDFKLHGVFWGAPVDFCEVALIYAKAVI